MKRNDFINHLESIAPPDRAEDFDIGRIGLILEGKEDISVIACALDATPAVVSNAADYGVDALVVHHPTFWHPMHGITGRPAEILRPLIKNDINLYAMHTNFDHANGGINDALAETLHLKNCHRMNKNPSSLGVVGDITLSPSEIATILGGGLRIWGNISQINRIAVVGGAAFDLDLISEAQSLGAQAYLSSELKYNLALESPIPLIEATHYALEAPGMRALAKRENWIFIEDMPEITVIE